MNYLYVYVNIYYYILCICVYIIKRNKEMFLVIFDIKIIISKCIELLYCFIIFY